MLAPVSVFEVEIGETYDVGEIAGGYRRVISIAGGTVRGPVLSGVVLPGGADWNTTRPDGSADVWARYTIRTDDGVTIGVINSGVLPANPEGVVYTQPRLEVPAGPYEWLNSAPLVGTLRPLEGRAAVEIGIFRLTDG